MVLSLLAGAPTRAAEPNKAVHAKSREVQGRGTPKHKCDGCLPKSTWVVPTDKKVTDTRTKRGSTSAAMSCLASNPRGAATSNSAHKHKHLTALKCSAGTRIDSVGKPGGATSGCAYINEVERLKYIVVRLSYNGNMPEWRWKLQPIRFEMALRWNQ